MEAVPRLPMLSLELKSSPESPSFAPKLKQYIAECYREDPESYNNEIHQLEGLRSAAVRPAIDKTGIVALKRYFCQLRGLQSRFPMAKGQPAAVTFAWRDLFANIVCPLADIRFEMVCILYNIGALHCKLGAAEPRTSPDSMKTACTNFQSAVWAFQHLKEHYPQPSGVDLSPEIMKLFQDICLAQAQECILEKSMQDNRRPSLIGAIGMQAIQHYRSALIALESSQSDSLQETVGMKTCNSWIKSISFKVSYIMSVVYLFQGMNSEVSQRMGERVAYFQAASDKLQEAKKLSKGLPQIEAINEALTFTNDVVEGKRKAAKNENEYIYHEEVPEKDLLTEPKPAPLAKGIPINFNDLEVSGPDIFGRLVPMRAHEASSMYSEEKAKLLRKIGTSVEIKDMQLNEFMSSLQLEELNILNDPERLPQDLIDICASLSAKSDAIQNLIDTMNTLADIHTEVDSMFTEIKHMIEDEDKSEKDFQQIMGKRPPSNVSTELSREANKYLEAHNKANESNQTLHKAMTLHLANLKILSLPLEELEKHVPSLESIRGNIDNNSVGEMRSLVEKVNEMRAQRSMLMLQLRESVNTDDITSQLLTRTGESLDEIFKQEIEKHNKTVTLIEQNMIAQENILKALTDAYAKYAASRKIISDVLRKREAFFTAMTTSFETYEDLMKKSLKGIEFYRKLSNTVSKLFSRLKSICKVQEEERSQLLASHVPKTAPLSSKIVPNRDVNLGNTSQINIKEEVPSGPKLKDFLPYMKNRNNSSQIPTATESSVDLSYSPQLYPPYIRPAPVGSEGTSDVPSTKCYDANAYKPNTSDYEGYKGYQSGQIAQYPEQTPYSYGNVNQNMAFSTYQPYPINMYNETDPNMRNTAQYPSQVVNPSEYVPNVPVNPNYANVTNYPINDYSKETLNTNYYNYNTSVMNQPSSEQLQLQNQQINQNFTGCIQPTYSESCQVDQNNLSIHMQNMNIASQTNNFSTENANSVYHNASINSSNIPKSIEMPSVLPQQNLNINPAHITSTINSLNMNVYNKNTFEPGYVPDTVNQPVNNYPLQMPTNPENITYNMPYQQPNTLSNYVPEEKITPTVETLPPHSSFDSNLPIQSHVQRDFLPKNSPKLSDYNNMYYNAAVSTSGDNTATQQYVYPIQDPVNYDTSYQYHPGYSYNVDTGTYDYNYGYQNSTANVSQNVEFSVSNNQTEIQPQQNVYTFAGAYVTTQTASTPVEEKQPYVEANNSQYYNIPYGHQSLDSNNTINTLENVNKDQQSTTNGSSLTYMTSNDTTTMTTNSNHGKGELKTASSIDSPDNVKSDEEKKPEMSSIDLLSGLDFSIEQPTLMPEIRVPPVSESVLRKLPVKENSEDANSIKSPFDEDEETEQRPPKRDIFLDPGTLNKFTQEIKSMQLFVDSFTKKTHSGITMLDSKWKKIQDSRVKENHLKTTEAAKNNMSKNVSPDVVAYDDSRVLFTSDNENAYVNASYVKQMSSWCVPLIITDLPHEDNYSTYWEMVFQQKVAVMVCLLSDIELQGKFYGPTAKSQTLEFPSGISVKLDDINCNVNWTERNMTVFFKKQQHKITHFQINVFPARVVSAPLVMLADKILSTEDENVKDNEFPVVLVHCSTGAGRSALIALLIMVMCQVRSGFVDLRDMLDAGMLYLCSKRTNILEDTKYLVDIYRTVLFYVQGVLCSGNIMFNGETISAQSGASVPPPHISSHSKKLENFNKFSKESFEEMKQAAGLKSGDMQDPLSYLDPLWSLKKRKD